MRVPLPGTRSVAGQVLFLQVVVAALLITAAVVVLALQVRQDSREDAQSRSLAAAQFFAAAPGTVEALKSQARPPCCSRGWKRRSMGRGWISSP